MSSRNAKLSPKMQSCILLVALISSLTRAQDVGFAGEEACERISKVEIRYLDYYILYLGHNTTTDKVDKTGRFYHYIKETVHECCPQLDLKFIKENATTELHNEKETGDVEIAALSLLTENETTPRPFVFFFPEFAVNKEKIVYDYELQFVKLARSPGPAVVMLTPSSKHQVSVFTIFKESGAMIVFMLTLSWFVGILGWVTDHWKNPEEFPSPFIIGMFEGFWWAIVTMTTVGYGDKAPKSVPARILAVMWVMISAVFLSLFTANATSILQQGSQGQDYSQTIGKKIGVFQSKDFDEFHLNLEAEVINFDNYDKMVGAFFNHDIDRFLFPDYKDLMWVLDVSYPEAKETFEIAKVLESPFQVGMVLAVTPELLNVHDNAFLKCLRTGISIRDKKEKQALKYGSLVNKKRKKDDNVTALNQDNLHLLTYYLLAVIGCLACCGMAWDLWKYHSKRTHIDNENNLDIEPGNENGGMTKENEEDKDSPVSKHVAATWF